MVTKYFIFFSFGFLYWFCLHINASLYDPHLFPSTGPYFEGWYLKLTDVLTNTSYGLAFGTSLPESGNTDSNHALVMLLRSNESGPLQSSYVYPDISTVTIQVDGKEVTENPGVGSLSNFTWKADKIGEIRVIGQTVKFNFTVQNTEFSGMTEGIVQWDAAGRGPEGYLGYLPLPLHWFVYSLQSNVSWYSWRSENETITGHNGQVHMEKNWGGAFPTAWLWMQGTNQHPNVSFAAAMGPVDFAGPLVVYGHLIGYRNYEKKLELNFRPDSSLLTITQDGCTGEVHLEVTGFGYKLSIDISARADTFSKCLPGPTKTGFMPVCSETYKAVAEVHAYKWQWIKYREVDHQIIYNSALEFGGTYMCGQCT